MGRGHGGTGRSTWRSGGGAEPHSPELERNLQLWEGAIRNRGNENVLAFDDKGMVKYMSQGDESSAEVEYDKIKNMVVTHNHPQESDHGLYRIGKSFSSADLKAAIGADVKEMRIVTPTYTFSIQRPRKGWGKTESQVESAYNNIGRNVIGKRDTAYWKAGRTQAEKEQRVERVFATQDHRIVKELARQFGWTYTYKKR